MVGSASSVIRVGIVGAGDNTRKRHIPGLRAVPNVQITAVANRTSESSARVAAEFGIPRVHADWQSLVADPDIDAVVIGTWPNLHSEVTCAALAAGKDVLCEARMARNVSEAQSMVQASREHPERIAMLVPSPFGLVSEREIRQLISDRFLGEIREIVVIGADDQFYDYSNFLHWRQDAEISGVNVLTLGILHETVSRWVPQPTRLFAQTQTFEPTRPNPEGSGNRNVTVPDSVQVLTQYANGARGVYRFSGIDLQGPGKQIHLYGSAGTIKLLLGEQERILVGRMGDRDLREIQIPPEMRGGWNVEAEFIGAIRGQNAVVHTDFATGLKYMEFTEAVARSAQSGLPVDLPAE